MYCEGNRMVFRARRRRFDISRSLDKVIEALRKHYLEFFENLDTGLPPEHEYIPSESGVLPESWPDETVGKRWAEETVSEIERRGIEAVAVYVPYHLTRNWGIYVFLEKLNGLAYFVSQKLSIPFINVFACCERAVMEHERFHFRAGKAMQNEPSWI